MAGEDHSEDGRQFPDYGDAIDPNTFDQILEMDDDEDDRDFSKTIVLDFFEQAQTTFMRMEEALEEQDLHTLSSLGHFLKGSSATLGLIRVKDACEKIQHWGMLKDETGDKPLDKGRCLQNIRDELPHIRLACDDAERRLKRFYREA